MFSVIDLYHQTNTESHKNISVDDLANLLFAKYSKEHPVYQQLVQQLKQLDVSKESSITLLNTLVRNQKLKDISIAAYEVTEGRLDFEKFQTKLSDFSSTEVPAAKEDESPFVNDSLEAIVNETFKQKGLRWRLKTLNKMLGSLRKGDFGFVFARPETGKTTFLTSEITHFAEQLSDEDGPILWFNNEEVHNKVLLRVYQASLGWTLEQILSDLSTAQAKYQELTKGKIKLVNHNQITKPLVEKYCKTFKPSLIIFDQIDKVTGFDADREDLVLGKVYQWGRELAKQYGPVIAICQADGSGENVKWLTMNNVSNAKTSKQAEADWILGIGAIHENGYENLRYLHLSKNKLTGDEDSDPNLRHGKMEVLIQPNIARYKDLHK